MISIRLTQSQAHLLKKVRLLLLRGGGGKVVILAPNCAGPIHRVGVAVGFARPALYLDIVNIYILQRRRCRFQKKTNRAANGRNFYLWFSRFSRFLRWFSDDFTCVFPMIFTNLGIMQSREVPTGPSLVHSRQGRCAFSGLILGQKLAFLLMDYTKSHRTTA